MTVAIGTYVGTATLIERLGGTANMGTSDNSLLQTICDQVNTYIESVTGRVIAPLSAGTYTFDIAEPTTVLQVPFGVQSVTSVLAAGYTGATYSTATASDVFLRPSVPRAGWPYTEIRLSDVPTGTVTEFSPGYDTVKVIGTFGWAAIPDDIAEVAVTLAVKTWHSRQSGQADVVGTDEMGQPVVSKLLSKKDRDTLFRYTVLGAF